RYDIRLEPHHHFICRRCGRIEDVAADRVRVETKGMELNDHEIEGLEVVVHGLCAECRQEEEDGVR
ncbi:transcriptional repressor, partial [Acinetobacter baumannii]